MQCPVCKDKVLVMANREGIEIDYCPQCRGVWLDRGELDKIIDRSQGAAQQAPAMASPAPPPLHQPYPAHARHDGHYRGHPGDQYKKRKREGLLSELFDFD